MACAVHLASAARRAHNPSVLRAPLLVFARVLFVTVSVGVMSFADLRASATAMACCAKTDYTCAGLSAPDDCCQHMGHAAHASPAGPPSGFRLFQPVVSIGSPILTDPPSPTWDSGDAVSAFKRPHDPPHLHAHCLLI